MNNYSKNTDRKWAQAQKPNKYKVRIFYAVQGNKKYVCIE